MFGKRLRTRYARSVAIGLLGVVVGACVFGLPALASTSHQNAQARHHQRARAGTIKSPGDAQSADSRVQDAAKAAIAGLVTSGTINQHQADVIDAQVIAGSVDSQQLVSSGVLSASQMSAVDNALMQVKQSFAGSTGSANNKTASAGAGDNSASPGAGDKTKSPDANAQAAEARLQAAVKAALDGLVANGTITQHQADVIDSGVNSGSVDFAQLVSSGVLSQSQMNAVGNALAQAKSSFAGQQ